jgi:hypothetical protein
MSKEELKYLLELVDAHRVVKDSQYEGDALRFILLKEQFEKKWCN